MTTSRTLLALLAALSLVGCATEPAQVHVDPQLLADGLHYHAYMRYRILLTRLMPMIGIDPVDYLD